MGNSCFGAPSEKVVFYSTGCNLIWEMRVAEPGRKERKMYLNE